MPILPCHSRAIIAPAVLLGILGAAGCGSIAPPTEAQAPRPAPTIEQIRTITFSGISPAQGAAEARLGIIPDIRMVQDLDGDGNEEAAVLLSASAGETGGGIYLAIAGWKQSRPVHIATAFVGERVQLRKARIGASGVTLDLVQAGPNDPMCCPGLMVTRSWRLTPKGLLEQPSTAPPTRLTLEAIRGPEWVLRAWTTSEPAPAKPAVSFRYGDGKFTGTSGCNRLFVTVRDGRAAGEVSAGLAGGTREACPAPIDGVESRFLKQLSGARSFGFLNGQLRLNFETGGTYEAMLFAEAAE